MDGDLIDLDDLWYENYEITSTGAILVRPDGHVAWRSMSMVDKPKEVLMKYFRDRYLSGGIDEYSH